MKKIILSISLLLLGFLCSAAVVTESEAAKYAQKFFRTSDTMKLVANSEQISGASGMEAPVYYIFNNPAGGWVIISGEDTSMPVLGYSYKGSFEIKGMPGNVKYYMNDLGKDMKDLRSYNLARDSKIEKAWNTVGQIDKNAPKKAKKTIESAQWNQSSPYNKYSPIAGTPAGCVATAMAIVMRHNKWPEKGKGTIPAYYSGSTPVKARDINGKTYDWDNMPLTDAIAGGWTDSQVDLVADLLLDCGCMVEMEYSSSGSGAYSTDVAPALGKYMSYSKSAKLYERCLFTKDEWNNKILEELSNNRLVYYAGSGSGGHAFVCDGIDTGASDEKYLRINWGWGGSYNGWFTRDLYISSSYNFGSSQEAIFGLAPDPSGTSTDPKPEVYFEPYGGKYGFELISGEIKKGSKFQLEANYIMNMGSVQYKGKLATALADKDGKIAKMPTDGAEVTLGKYNYTGLSTTEIISDDIKITDHIVLVNKVNGYSEWEEVLCDQETAGFLSTLGVTGSKIILYEDDVKAGDRLTLKLTPGQKGEKEVSWKFNGANVKDAITLVSGKNEIIANITYTDGGTEEVVLTLNL